jgi:sugar phosphate isomerase/epimerase
MFRNLSPGAVGIRLPLAETLALASSVGWEGIDLPVGEAARIADQQGVEALMQMFSDAHMQAGGWGLPLNWRAEYDAAALEELGRQAALAAQLGCMRCYTWLLPFSDDLPFRENFEQHVRQLTPVAQVLGEHGCALGLEFIGPRTMRADHRYGFIYTAEGMLSLATAIGANVGLLFDAWHWYTGLGTLSDIRMLRAEDVIYVHINDAPAGIAVGDQIDNVRCLPGATGVIDLAGFLGTLREIGYRGPVTPEPFDKELAARTPAESCSATFESLTAVWPQESGEQAQQP